MFHKCPKTISFDCKATCDSEVDVSGSESFGRAWVAARGRIGDDDGGVRDNRGYSGGLSARGCGSTVDQIVWALKSNETSLSLAHYKVYVLMYVIKSVLELFAAVMHHDVTMVLASYSVSKTDFL